MWFCMTGEMGVEKGLASLFEASFDALDIELLVLPDTNLILLSAVVEPLRAANRIAGNVLYRWRMFSSDGAFPETTSQIPIPVMGLFDPQREAVPLFVLSSYFWRRHITTSLKMRLSRTAKYRSVIAGIESGTWFLAESGLLGDCLATIHWEDQEEFARAYPQISLSRDRYVIDRKRITTGGPMPTLDLMLEIIRTRQGYSLALEVARLFGHVPPRFASDAAYSAPRNEHRSMSDPRVGRAIQIMEKNIEQPVRLSRIAAEVGVSSRHLRELFQSDAGIAPHLHYLALRLNAARRMVIESETSLTEIAALTGYESAAAFSRSYRLRFGESASETRRRQRHPQLKPHRAG